MSENYRFVSIRFEGPMFNPLVTVSKLVFRKSLDRVPVAGPTSISVTLNEAALQHWFDELGFLIL